ncbi:MAG: 7TM diverse intracellular signaling domain-containing protein, partial [Ketobacteraceae bacterium]|nr:7TM diverse intracellular signaling domain-containing protein [Ketobacteraceae bacterium]
FLATPLFVITADQLVHVTNWQRSFIIPYYGMILIMLFYNFFTYTFVRHKSYLYYFGHIFFLLLYQAVMDGFIQETLIRAGDWLYLRGPVVYAGLANLCAMNFTRYMLDITREDVWEDRALKACIGLILISLVLELVLHNRVASAAMMLTYSINSALALVVIYSIFRKGNKLAGYFLVAWATYPLLITTYGITMMGYITPDQLSAQAPRLGGILETILLSVALGYRVELLRREKLQLQQSINQKLQQEITDISQGIQSLAGGNLSYSPRNRQGAMLANLSRDFERLAAALRTTEQDRNRWLSDISHELKTPISVFKATIESLQDGVFEVNDEALERLHKEATRLERLVLDLHELNQCESGGFNFTLRPVNIPEVLAHEIGFFKPLLDEKQLEISLHLKTGEGVVNADEKRIAQLFANLLNNSIRYTDAPGIIRVMVYRDNDWLTIEWEDSAPGVSCPDELEHLFDRLYKVDRSRARDDTGTGLGLSICKAIVEAHQGAASVTESALGGLKFCFKLPLLDTTKADSVSSP